MSNRLKISLVIFLVIQIGILTWVYQDNTKLDHIIKSLLENPDEVESLNLSNLDIDELPKDLLLFTNLEHINLSNNRFKSIPKILYEIPSLVSIDLSYNKMKNVEIANTETFERIDLSHNKIKSVEYDPCNVGCWENLRTIDLSYNRLDMSPYFGDSQKLDTILLSNNPLDGFYNMRKSMPKANLVEYLDMSSTKLPMFDENVNLFVEFNYDDLRMLAQECESLNISNNHYEYFPLEIFSENNYNLAELNIANSKFNDKLIRLSSNAIEVLNLSGLDLDFYSTDMFVNFPNLKKLSVANTKFKTFNYKNAALLYLDISHITVDEMTLNLSNLKTLIIDKEKINTLKTANLPNLKRLKINGNLDNVTKKNLEQMFPSTIIEFIEN